MNRIDERAHELLEQAVSADQYGIDYHEERYIRESDALEAIRNALMPQWQPIETVPHGKWVYVTALGASCGGVAMLADYWINPDMRPDQYAERATHWMPLPDQSQLP